MVVGEERIIIGESAGTDLWRYTSIICSPENVTVGSSQEQEQKNQHERTEERREREIARKWKMGGARKAKQLKGPQE